MKALTFILFWLCAVLVVSADNAATLYQKAATVYESDPSAAFSAFGQAAEAGHVGAMVGFATCYEKGHGTEVDYAKALEWYENAARKNSLKACEGLARIYASCPDPAFHDGEKAVRLASAVLSKRRSDVDALNLMTVAYLRAIRVDEAVATGLQAVKYATSIEEAERLKSKIPSYRKGQPVPAAATEKWMIQAAEHDVEWAVVQLASMVADQSGPSFNPRLAIRMYEKAIKQMGRTELYIGLGHAYLYEGRMDEAVASFRAMPREHYKGRAPVEVRYAGYLRRDKEEIYNYACKIRDGYVAVIAKKETIGGETELPNGNTITRDEQEVTIAREKKVKPDPEGARFLFEVAAIMGHPKAIAELRNDEGSQ